MSSFNVVQFEMDRAREQIKGDPMRRQHELCETILSVMDAAHKMQAILRVREMASNKQLGDQVLEHLETEIDGVFRRRLGFSFIETIEKEQV